MHAFAGCVSGPWMRRKLSRTAQGESSARSFDVRCPRLQLLHAILALPGSQPCPEGFVGVPLPRASRRFARQCALFVMQALAQCLEVIQRSLLA